MHKEGNHKNLIIPYTKLFFGCVHYKIVGQTKHTVYCLSIDNYLRYSDTLAWRKLFFNGRDKGNETEH